MSDTARSLQPMVEDYNSDESDGHVLEKNFPRKVSPTAQANVSTKRSNDLKTDRAPPVDLRSDSGYSSYTAASKSSADSATSQPSPPVAAPPLVSTNPAPKPRRPTIGDARQPSNESSPRRKTPSRTLSVSKPRPSGERSAGQPLTTITRSNDPPSGECTDPNCNTCGPNAPNARQIRRPPTASALEFASYASDQASYTSHTSDPNPYYNPPSPTYTRNQYNLGPVIMQPSQSRRRSSSTVRVRPQSYAGEPGPSYWVQPPMPITGYPSPPHDSRGPPPSMSAYQHMNYPHVPPHFMAQSALAPQSTPFYQAPANPASPPYDVPRPRLSTRESSNYRQQSHAAPIITHDSREPSKYSARYGQSQQPPTPSEYHNRGHSQVRRIQDRYTNDESSSEEDDDDEYHEQHDARTSRAHPRALMPPPEIPERKRSKSTRRPTLTSTKTAPVETRDRRQSIVVPERRQSIVMPERRQSIVVPERRQSIVVPERRQSIVMPERPKTQQREREHERERDRLERTLAAPVRRQSVSRPRLHREAQSEYDTRNAQLIVNNSRSERRQTYQGGQGQTYETVMRQALAEQQRQKRASRVYEDRDMPGGYFDDEEEEEEDEPRQPLARPRRKTDAGKSKERTLETKNRKAENAAEEYINSTRGSRAPVADSVNKAAKRASQIPDRHSESSSSHSDRSGKQSISQRTNMTNGANNEIRLRVDASAPIALSFNGDMEGRTLQLLPAENGMTDVVIGNRETTYHSERGSVAGNHRRSIVGSQARREAEDMISERSTRSVPHNRRERDEPRAGRYEQDERHVLRRVRNTTYHRD